LLSLLPAPKKRRALRDPLDDLGIGGGEGSDDADDDGDDPEPRRTRTRDTLIRRPDKAILPDSGYSVKSCIIKASHD